MASVLNIKHDQGATFVAVLTIKDSNGDPVNISGYLFEGMVRTKYLDTNPVFSFDFTIKNQVTDLGKVEMTLPATATEGLALKADTTYVYDVEMTYPDLVTKTRIFQGKFTVSPEVTKP